MRAPFARLAAGLAAVACLALPACTGSSASGTSGGGSNTFTFSSATKLGDVFPAAQRKPAEDFSGQLLDGTHTWKLSSTRGKIVVVNFWAAWCPPCRTETPQFDTLYRQVKNTGVDFVGIDIKDVRSNAQAFVAANHITYPMIYDEQGKVAVQLGNLPAPGPPFTVLIDQRGKVAAVYFARLSALDLQHAIAKLR